MRCILNWILVFVSISLNQGCLEEYDLNQNKNNNSIVIDGLISNESGPYYIRITKSSSTLLFGNYTEPFYSYKNAEPIANAIVIVSDDQGNVDTLSPATSTIQRYYYEYDSIGNLKDSVFWYEDTLALSGSYGFYQTNTLQGRAGHTYHLYVKAENKEFQAECYMPPVPAIDSMHIKEIIVKEADGSKGLVPIIYFKEPQETKDFYFFDIGGWGFGRWTYSVLDDSFLDPYVNGFSVDDGFHPDWWNVNYPDAGGEGEITVTMESLTKEAYDYYRGLISQFNNDGGVYSPAPSSPKPNISGGGLGFFRASAVSRITKKYGQY